MGLFDDLIVGLIVGVVGLILSPLITPFVTKRQKTFYKSVEDLYDYTKINFNWIVLSAILAAITFCLLNIFALNGNQYLELSSYYGFSTYLSNLFNIYGSGTSILIVIWFILAPFWLVPIITTEKKGEFRLISTYFAIDIAIYLIFFVLTGAINKNYGILARNLDLPYYSLLLFLLSAFILIYITGIKIYKFKLKRRYSVITSKWKLPQKEAFALLLFVSVLPLFFYVIPLYSQPTIINSSYKIMSTQVSIKGYLLDGRMPNHDNINLQNYTVINETIKFSSGSNSIILPQNFSPLSIGQINNIGIGILPNGTIQYTWPNTTNFHIALNHTSQINSSNQYVTVSRINNSRNSTEKVTIDMYLNSTDKKLFNFSTSYKQINTTAYGFGIRFISNDPKEIGLDNFWISPDADLNGKISNFSILNLSMNTTPCTISNTSFQCTPTNYLDFEEVSGFVGNSGYALDIQGGLRPYSVVTLNFTLVPLNSS